MYWYKIQNYLRYFITKVSEIYVICRHPFLELKISNDDILYLQYLDFIETTKKTFFKFSKTHHS